MRTRPQPYRSQGPPWRAEIESCDMRHATSETLQEIEPLLEKLRSVPGLVEKRPGIFYRRSRAVLHFHEDPSGLHADVRIGEEFEHDEPA